jgi:hypothetical protein
MRKYPFAPLDQNKLSNYAALFGKHLRRTVEGIQDEPY